MTTLTALADELITLVTSVPAFQEQGYAFYSLEDLLRLTQLQTLPIVAVGYNGAAPVAGNRAANVEARSHTAVLCELQFLVVVSVQYQFAGQEDTKPTAYALLDQVRTRVSGFKGVNQRAWQWMGEQPEPEAAADSVIFYSQRWHTVMPVVGEFNRVTF